MYYYKSNNYHEVHKHSVLFLSSPARGKHSDGAHGSFNPVAELKKLRQAQQNRCRLEIGEVLRVRGLVKTSRQQREIMASTYCECKGLSYDSLFNCRPKIQHPLLLFYQCDTCPESKNMH